MNRTVSHIILAAIALATITSSVHAQRRGGAGGPGQGPQGSVNGSVIDAATNEPLKGASIVLRGAADSTILAGAIADHTGTFAISGVRPGRYHARVSFVGYVTYRADVTVKPDEPSVALGAIALHMDTTLGKDITVTAKREFMTQAIDRTIFRTADLAVATGGTATDILRNIPSIEVDVDGKVSLRGNQNVVIQINGRPSMLSGDALAAFLQGLPASAIERVEVIPNPSAKYDPDGMSGIINIVLRQDSNRGLSGGVNGSIGTHETYNAGGNISYGAGPWNLFGSYGFNYSNRGNSGANYRETHLPGITPYLDQSSSGTHTTPSHVFNGSVDYMIDRSNTLSLTAMASHRDETSDESTLYLEHDSTHALVRRSDRSSNGNELGTNMDYHLSFKTVFEPTKHEWTTELRYATDNNDETSAYLGQDLALDGSHANDTTARQHTEQDSRYREITAQTDYTQTFGSIKLEAGYKADLERLNSTFFSETFDNGAAGFTPDSALNNTFVFNRQIHAAYTNLGGDFGAFSAQAGVRLEQALTTFDLTTTGNSYRNDYFSVFPSAFVTYKPSEATQLKASYSKRINRPNTWSLNPFVSQDDPLFRRTGNPYLKPEYTDSYEFSASGFTENASLTVTPYFRHTTDVMRRIARVDSVGVTTVTRENLATNDSYGAEMIGTLRVGDWFNGMLSGGGYRYVTDASNVDETYNNNAFGWNMRANVTLTPMTGLDLQITYFYRAAMQVEGGTMGSMSQADIALQQKVFDDRGRVGLRVSDPFNTMGFNVTRNSDGFYQDIHHRWDSRNVFLTFSYTFGTPDRSRRNTGQQRPSGGDPMDME